MGLNGKYIVHKNKRFDYTYRQIEKTIGFWNNGDSWQRIAEYFGIGQLEVLFLITDLAEKDLIQPRPGGYNGTKPYKRKRQEKMRIELDMS